jgi:hypothetical protein
VRTTIQERFAHHPPSTSEVAWAHERVREICLRAAEELVDLVPDCREFELAIEALDLACMHANAAVARTQLGRVTDPRSAE